MTARAAWAAECERGALTSNAPAPNRIALPRLLLQADNVLDQLAPTKRLHDLGLEATSMELPGFSFLHRFRQGMGGHFA